MAAKPTHAQHELAQQDKSLPVAVQEIAHYQERCYRLQQMVIDHAQPL